MSTAAKISISLPRPLLDRADRERRATGETRSEFLRRALQAYFETGRRGAEIRRYVEGYVAEPESEYEVSAATALSKTAFEEEGWE